jgi:coenzyme F420-reducing hydrogenase delta subunit
MDRSDMVAELMEDFGYESERFNLTWVSSAEPDKFVEAVTEMTARIKKLGPVGGEQAQIA